MPISNSSSPRSPQRSWPENKPKLPDARRIGFAVLSHELRTPLTPVLMAVSAISSEKGLSDDVLDALDMIQRNIKVEARLIEDLLDLTRIARNKVELQLEQLDVHVALEQALKTASPISSKESSPPPAAVRKEEPCGGRLCPSATSLLEFDQECGQVYCRRRRDSYSVANKDGQILVEVSDTGVGIVPELLTRIFNPF